VARVVAWFTPNRKRAKEILHLQCVIQEASDDGSSLILELRAQ
jgi:hypothetical protein